MRIGKGRVVDIDYSLHLGDGKVVDASEPGSPLSYIHGEGQIVPGLERALEGLGTGESKQVTDGLSDAFAPAWDAGGKYLWFLASTNLGLASQWLDMTSYDRVENFGLYFAVLKKTDPSPLLPESDEDTGVGAAPEREAPDPNAPDAPRPGSPRGNRGEAAAAPAEAGTKPEAQGEKPDRAPRKPVTVQIDFEGLSNRIVAVTSVPERPYGALKAGAVVVATNPLYVEREVEHQFNDAGIELAVVFSRRYPLINAVRARTKLASTSELMGGASQPSPSSERVPISTRIRPRPKSFVKASTIARRTIAS